MPPSHIKFINKIHNSKWTILSCIALCNNLYYTVYWSVILQVFEGPNFPFLSTFQCPNFHPILHRQVCKKRKKSVSKHFAIYYVAPCGRRLRTIEEIFNYLRITESALEIDCFSFEVTVVVTTEWEPFRKIFFTNVSTVHYNFSDTVRLTC